MKPPFLSAKTSLLTYFCDSFWLSEISRMSRGAPFWCAAMSASMRTPYLPLVDIFMVLFMPCYDYADNMSTQKCVCQSNPKQNAAYYFETTPKTRV